MARTRYIKPGFFKNESLAENGPWKRILFAGLWVLADKSGRLEDRPKRIKPDVFPYDDEITSERIDQLLAELASGDDPFIVRYEAGGKRLIQVVKWLGHQSPHRNEAESILPSHRTSKNTEQKITSHPLDEASTTKGGTEASHSRNDASPNGEWGMGNGELEMGDGEPSPEAPGARDDEVPPVWRESKPRTTTLVQPRSQHANCYDAPQACQRGLCIPRFLGLQWEAQAGSGQPDGYSSSGYVITFVNACLRFAIGPVGADPLKWWRQQWAEKHGVTATREAMLSPKEIHRLAHSMGSGSWASECVRHHDAQCGGPNRHRERMAVAS